MLINVDGLQQGPVKPEAGKGPKKRSPECVQGNQNQSYVIEVDRNDFGPALLPGIHENLESKASKVFCIYIFMSYICRRQVRCSI